jgi:FKBP-type peptidyl-prolyl cis-trans isomerase SlyD
MIVADEKVISIHYTLKNAAGDILDSSSGKDPLVYMPGVGNLIPGLERALLGKTVGDAMPVVVLPEDGYGVRSENLVQTVSMSMFQDPDQVKLGIQFQAQTHDSVRLATVTKIVGENVTIDMNHPLADETLYFDVEIVAIRDATEEERSHGHVHAHGGHAH